MVEHALNPIRQSFHEHCAAGMVYVVGRAVTRLCVPCTVRIFTVAMADALAKVPDAEVDPEGTFKYILVRIKVKDGTEYKDIVRGTKSAGQYHSKFALFLSWLWSDSIALKRPLPTYTNPALISDNVQLQACVLHFYQWQNVTDLVINCYYDI